ncbi:acyl-CoA thioesterase [Candidatus Blastococcus massiliensis]|uniref:acyl-CoA thioesterase n=1 Tax=Candidatus Blastococcus massiliensis TaxID=1470358 RepID=UPI0004AED993|nr:thioesterase family protein [Candidatus Blastococcus massiliensis]
MSDLGVDTQVEQVDEGRFRATPSPEWDIWGPMGGYIASFALRAVGATAHDRVPAAFSCHYLGVARPEPIDIEVHHVKPGRVASSSTVAITQNGKPILNALVWAVAENEGLEHDETVPPDVPGPDELKSIEELVPAGSGPPFPFWNNLEGRPVAWEDAPPDGPRPAVWQEWLRFRTTATFPDPWTDAARSVILIDLPSWPSAHRPHAWQRPAYIAPTLDLNVAFHRPATEEPWLLCDGSAPVSTRGMFGWRANVWSPGGTLHASGGGQCLYRRRPS